MVAPDTGADPVAPPVLLPDADKANAAAMASAGLPPAGDDSLHDFHPAVQDWFRATFVAPTPAQAAAWPLLRAGRTTLVAAPTGSGKTLTAFLAALNDLIVRGTDCLESGTTLPDETAVLYVSPLKALSNDIQKNLRAPLAGIGAALSDRGLRMPEIRTAVRTGDTPQAERAAMARRPPHIVVTTPESLYVLLGSDSGRRMLSTVRTVIIDEIHAVAPSKRGAHLALGLARLDALCERYHGRQAYPMRVGLSATQKPIERMAAFLAGVRPNDGDTSPPHAAAAHIVDIGHYRERDLSPWHSRLCHWTRSCRTTPGIPSMTGSVCWHRNNGPRWYSSTRGAWPNVPRDISRTASATTQSRRIMAACRGHIDWMPNTD